MKNAVELLRFGNNLLQYKLMDQNVQNFIYFESLAMKSVAFEMSNPNSVLTLQESTELYVKINLHEGLK